MRGAFDVSWHGSAEGSDAGLDDGLQRPSSRRRGLLQVVRGTRPGRGGGRTRGAVGSAWYGSLGGSSTVRGRELPRFTGCRFGTRRGEVGQGPGRELGERGRGRRGGANGRRRHGGRTSGHEGHGTAQEGQHACGTHGRAEEARPAARSLHKRLRGDKTRRTRSPVRRLMMLPFVPADHNPVQQAREEQKGDAEEKAR